MRGLPRPLGVLSHLLFLLGFRACCCLAHRAAPGQLASLCCGLARSRHTPPLSRARALSLSPTHAHTRAHGAAPAVFVGCRACQMLSLFGWTGSALVELLACWLEKQKYGMGQAIRLEQVDCSALPS